MPQAPRPDPVRARPAVEVLTSPAFVAALLVLLANDRVLKPAFHNALTGKLSDVAGLFAFALFCLAFAPGRRRVVAGIAVLFLLWKSHLTDPLLAFWNAHVSGLHLARVVDYTDWLALVVLPLAYRVATGAGRSGPRGTWTRRLRQVRAAAAGIVGVLAFAATSRPAPYYDLSPWPTYLIRSPRDSVWAALMADHWEQPDLRGKRRIVEAADTLYGTPNRHYATWFSVELALRDHPGCGTDLVPLSSQTMRKTVDLDAMRVEFINNVVEPLRHQVEPTAWASCGQEAGPVRDRITCYRAHVTSGADDWPDVLVFDPGRDSGEAWGIAPPLDTVPNWLQLRSGSSWRRSGDTIVVTFPGTAPRVLRLFAMGDSLVGVQTLYSDFIMIGDTARPERTTIVATPIGCRRFGPRRDQY